jgi:hypothetical protein
VRGSGGRTQDGHDVSADLIEVERLQKLPDEGGGRQTRLLLRIVAADADDRHRPRLLVHLLEEPDAILHRQDDVGQNDVTSWPRTLGPRAVDTAVTVAPSKLSVCARTSRLSAWSSTTRILMPARIWGMASLYHFHSA